MVKIKKKSRIKHKQSDLRAQILNNYSMLLRLTPYSTFKTCGINKIKVLYRHTPSFIMVGVFISLCHASKILLSSLQ